jgi:integrase
MAEEAGGPSLHDLRHTAAAIMIKNGEHPKAISDRLGHSSISITMDLYGHRYESGEEEIAGRLDDSYQEAIAEAAKVVSIR